MSSRPSADGAEVLAHRALAVAAVVAAVCLLGLALWGWSRLSDGGFTELLVARRVLGLGLLFTSLFTIAGVWLWRRADYLSSLSPEYKQGLMKVRRGGDWLAETSDGRWLRWDALAADWIAADPPQDEALKRKQPSLGTPPPPPEPVLPAEAHLALWEAQRKAQHRRASLRRTALGVRAAGAFAMVAALLVVVAVLALMFLGALRFIADLPF